MTGSTGSGEQLGAIGIGDLRRRRWTGDLTFRAVLAALTLATVLVLGFIVAFRMI